MSEKTYRLHSVFKTIQGEGYHAGRLALFLRFCGCSVWSGREEDRQRDSKRHSVCALTCDTEFFAPDKTKHGGVYTLGELTDVVRELWGFYVNQALPFIVLTGGEPSLQADEQLVNHLHNAFDAYVTMETNGAQEVPKNLDWVTCSPKPPMPLLLKDADEVKVLSCFDPLPYGRLAQYRSIQPVDYGDERRDREELERCVSFVMAHPGWRIYVQLHKLLGID